VNLVMEALNAHARLVQEYTAAKGQRYLEALTDTWLTDSIGDVTPIEPADVDVFVRSAIRTLVQADTYAVTRDIVTMLEEASALLPNELTYAPQDIPSRFGFVYLEEPIVIIDVHERPCVVKAITWDLASDTVHDEPALLVMVWTAHGDPRDHLYEAFRELRDRTGELPVSYSMMWAGLAKSGMEIGERDTLARFIFAFLRFIQEPWIDSRMMVPGNRQFLRQMARKGRPDPRVRVVQLRKAEHRPRPERDDNDEHEPREWSHRWLVKGHWRNQWYPSEQRHALRWIPTYIKGPEDKELRLKDRVFQVER